MHAWRISAVHKLPEELLRYCANSTWIVPQSFSLTGSCWCRKGHVWQGNSLIIYVFLFSIWNRVDLLWNLQGSLFISFVKKGRSSRFNSASVCVTSCVAWHQHLGNNMLWRQNYSLEFCAGWWIKGSINPSNKFFVHTKQTNSLTWMIL